MTDAPSKACTRCTTVKPLEGFPRDKRRSDGRESRCKTCQAEYSAEYRANNPGKIAAYLDRTAEQRAEQRRAHRAANPERIREQAQAHYAENRDRYIENARAWQDANPHKRWESRYRKRSRKHGHEPVVNSFTRDELTARHGDACAYCGGPFERLAYHPVPVAQGGVHSLENCWPSCTACATQSRRQATT